jgi:hypothetical protein
MYLIHCLLHTSSTSMGRRSIKMISSTDDQNVFPVNMELYIIGCIECLYANLQDIMLLG